MVELKDREIAEYFQRSYTATDGLWFMKVEDRHGFDEALAADCEVWKVLPKIQARTLKALTHMEQGLDALFHCLTTKLHLEGYLFTSTHENEHAFKIMISSCPWYTTLVRTGRAPAAAKFGACVCRSEYEVWAHEFDGDARFEMSSFICTGSEYCQLEFRREANNPSSPEHREARNGE